MGPHPTWGGPIQCLDWGEGVVKLSHIVFSLNRNGYGNVIFSISLLTSEVGVGPHMGGWDPIPHGGVGPHPRYRRGCSLICGRRYLYLVHTGGHYCSNMLPFCLCCIFRSSIKIIIQ